MKAQEALQLATQHNDNGEHKKALILLEKLYQVRPEHLEINRQRLRALYALEKTKLIQQAVDHLVEHTPDVVEAWQFRAEYYAYIDKLDLALSDLNQCLKLVPLHRDLLSSKAGYLLDKESYTAAFNTLDLLVDTYPDDAQVYLERASAYEGYAYTPRQGDAIVTDVVGMEYGAASLQQAVNDLSRAIELEPDNWRYYLKRAGTLKKLQIFDAAERDYERVLNDLPDDDLREFIEEELASCRNNGQGERAQLISMLNSAMEETSAKERNTTGYHMANSAIQAAVEQIEHGATLQSAFEEFITDDPEEMTAISIARDLFNAGNEPEPEFTVANASDYPKVQQKFCNAAALTLSEKGFVSHGDFDPRHLQHMLGSPTMMRIFSSRDGRACAAAYHFKPLWPGFIPWLLMVVTRQWKKPRVVDIETELSDGSFLVTHNAGNLSPLAYGDKVQVEALPLKSGIQKVIARHWQRLEEHLENNPQLSIREVHNMEEINALQNRLRETKNAYRRSINYVTETELRGMLGKAYDQFSDKIYERLQRFAQTSGAEQ